MDPLGKCRSLDGPGVCRPQTSKASVPEGRGEGWGAVFLGGLSGIILGSVLITFLELLLTSCLGYLRVQGTLATTVRIKA